MRSAIVLSVLAALALAIPRPQGIEFDQVDATPPPEDFTPPVDVTDNSVVIQPVANAVAVGDSSIDGVTSTQKRDFMNVLGKRDGDCSAQPAGSGPAVTT